MLKQQITLKDLTGDLRVYFNWSANVLMPIDPIATDRFLRANRSTILKAAQELLSSIQFIPTPIYRGILLKNMVETILPHKNFTYLSFTDDRSVAEHFADVKGFGSAIMNWEERLGKYGYVIEYIPTPTEVLFHYRFLSLLPYAEAFNLLDMNGQHEVEHLSKQKEITILQPANPFTKVTKLYE